MFSSVLTKAFAAARWCTPLIPTLRRQRQADLCKFKTSLVYRASSRTARAVTQRNPVLKKEKERKRKMALALFGLSVFPDI